LSLGRKSLLRVNKSRKKKEAEKKASRGEQIKGFHDGRSLLGVGPNLEAQVGERELHHQIGKISRKKNNIID